MPEANGSPQPAPASGIPTWAIILLAVGVVLIIVAITACVLIAVKLMLRYKKQPDAKGDTEKTKLEKKEKLGKKGKLDKIGKLNKKGRLNKKGKLDKKEVTSNIKVDASNALSARQSQIAPPKTLATNSNATGEKGRETTTNSTVIVPERQQLLESKRPASDKRSSKTTPYKNPNKTGLEISKVRSVVSSVKSPVPPSAKSLVLSSVKSPVPPSAKSPVRSSVKSPDPPSVKSLVLSSVKSPVPPSAKSQVLSSVKSPVPPSAKSLVLSSVKSPVPPSATSPVPPSVKSPVSPLVKFPVPPSDKFPVPLSIKSPVPPQVSPPIVPHPAVSKRRSLENKPPRDKGKTAEPSPNGEERDRKTVQPVLHPVQSLHHPPKEKPSETRATTSEPNLKTRELVTTTASVAESPVDSHRQRSRKDEEEVRHKRRSKSRGRKRPPQTPFEQSLLLLVKSRGTGKPPDSTGFKRNSSRRRRAKRDGRENIASQSVDVKGRTLNRPTHHSSSQHCTESHNDEVAGRGHRVVTCQRQAVKYSQNTASDWGCGMSADFAGKRTLSDGLTSGLSTLKDGRQIKTDDCYPRTIRSEEPRRKLDRAPNCKPECCYRSTSPQTRGLTKED